MNEKIINQVSTGTITNSRTLLGHIVKDLPDNLGIVYNNDNFIKSIKTL